MDEAPALSQRWASLLDPTVAQVVIDRIAKLELPRRICRPLDYKRKQIENAELAKFDADIDSAVEPEATMEQFSYEIQPE